MKKSTTVNYPAGYEVSERKTPEVGDSVIISRRGIQEHGQSIYQLPNGVIGTVVAIDDDWFDVNWEGMPYINSSEGTQAYKAHSLIVMAKLPKVKPRATKVKPKSKPKLPKVKTKGKIITAKQKGTLTITEATTVILKDNPRAVCGKGQVKAIASINTANTRYSLSTKMKAIGLHQEGMSCNKIALVIGCSSRSVAYWLKQYNETGFDNPIAFRRSVTLVKQER